MARIAVPNSNEEIKSFAFIFFWLVRIYILRFIILYIPK